jgi:uncharacterized radical SAM protein YgiQ
MIATRGSGFDVILVTGEPYADHPFSPAGVIARVLDARGYCVGVISSPDWKGREDFLKLGRPRLFFGVTSGSIDSMLVNYSPLKRERVRDRNVPFIARMPDRAVVVYANRIRELHRGAPIVIGGIEASLRRLAHYDYWDDAVRRSILLDTRADILVYGPGEIQVLKIAKRLAKGEGLEGIPSTCIVRSEAPAGAEVLPSFEDVGRDKGLFCEAQRRLSNRRLLAQGHANRFVVQYPSPEYKPRDLDWVYGLPFSRTIPEGYPELEMGKFSVVTHRGCFGGCSFCALSLHQGDRIVSRSEAAILEEIRRLTGHPGWKGFVDDLGGPTANMYGMDCESPCLDGSCLTCARLDRSHGRLIALLRKARRIPGVKKVFVRSGIRYDLALECRDYIEELAKHHISGRLKIAPEHVSEKVLRLMGKGGGRRSLEEFRRVFKEVNRKMGQGRGAAPQHLKYYFMVAHPGTGEKEAKELAAYLKRLEKDREKPVEGVQIFTPTPMTRSTCMYHTGIDPISGEPVYVPRTYAEKKAQGRMLTGAAQARDGRRE